MSKLWLDLETFNEAPITVGTHKYAETAEILIVALATDDDPVQAWDLTDGQDVERRMRALQDMIDAADEVIIHNSPFDRTVLRHVGVRLDASKVTDTMVLALMHSLPGSLGMLCDVLGVPSDKAKDKEGKKLIQLFTKPRPKNMKLRRATRDTHPAEWAAFIEYAKLDVDAMRDVYKRVPRWNDSPRERKFWLLDQTINDRGFAVDVDLAHAALRAFDRASRNLADAAALATNGLLRSTTQRDLLKQHLLEDHGFALPDLTKDTVARVLKGDDVPAPVRALLENRQQAAAASPAKYKALLKATSRDGRLRGTLQFCGASRTGRDAGRIFQPQNLPRPSFHNDEIEAGIAAMKADCEDLLFDSVSDLCASAVRGCIVADEGKQLAIADLSNIEGRVLAWLAGETWKVQAFKDYDTIVGHDAKGKPVRKGHDLYVMAYSKAFGVSPEDVIANKETGDGLMRQIGKVMELACLGPDTLVLTSNGLKAIVDVKTHDLLWDGIEWVPHNGLVPRGVKRVHRLAGVAMTNDHRVLTGDTWLPARIVGLSASTLALALETGSESLRSLALTSGRWADCVLPELAALAEQKVSPASATCGAKIEQTSDACVIYRPALTRWSAVFDIADAGPRNRFTVVSSEGALVVHNCGYQGGIGAFHKMGGAVAERFTEDEIRGLVYAWRDAHRNIKRFWYDVERAAKMAVQYPGETFKVRELLFSVRRDPTDVPWLLIKMPSGRFLTYRNPSVNKETCPDCNGEGVVLVGGEQMPGVDTGSAETKLCYPCGGEGFFGNNKLTYEGLNQYTRKWERLDTYGGKITENLVQAIAREVFFHGLALVEEEGYPVVLRVHDELVTEVSCDKTAERLADLMSVNPLWATGLPLAAAGYTTLRYRKD